MGIWEDLFGKHGHKKSKEIQELLAIIKDMQEDIKLKNIQILKEQNENKRLFRELQRCLHPPKKHGARFDVVFS